MNTILPQKPITPSLKKTHIPVCGIVLLRRAVLHMLKSLRLFPFKAWVYPSSFPLEPFLNLLTGLAKLTCLSSPASSRIALGCLIAEERLPGAGPCGFPPKLK